MNIAVYSGSFNPLHIGHLAIMKHLIEEAGFDMVYLIVSPKNPLKDSISSSSATDRYNAAVEAVNRHFRPEASVVKVDDIELTMPEPHYSIRTLEALGQREPENTFTLIMGADNLACIRNWKEYRNILTDFGIAVFPREGHDMEALRQDLMAENPEYRIRLLKAPLVTVSSTDIRNARQQGEDISNFLM
jgi:nicotinate-nucleotide adenylyltransferase